MVYRLYIIDIFEYTFTLLTYGLQCRKVEKFLCDMIGIMIIYFTTSWVGKTATQMIKIYSIETIIPKFYTFNESYVACVTDGDILNKIQIRHYRITIVVELM